MGVDLAQHAVAVDLMDVVERAREQRMQLLRDLKQIEARVAAIDHATRPPGEQAQGVLRRLAEAEERIAQRLGQLQQAEADVKRHTDAATRIEATMARLSTTLAQQLEAVRPAIRDVGQIKQQLRDAAHAAVAQTRTSIEALRSPVAEELARLEHAEAAIVQRLDQMRLGLEATMDQVLARTQTRMDGLLDTARAQAGDVVADFASQLQQAADLKVDDRIDRVSEVLDDHLRAVNHRLLAQQQQINDLLDHRQEHALAMLADAESIIEQCGQQFDHAQQAINQRLLQQRKQLSDMLDERHRSAVEAIAKAPVDTTRLATTLTDQVRCTLKCQVDAAIADTTRSLQQQAADLRESFAAMVHLIKSRAAKDLAAGTAAGTAPGTAAGSTATATAPPPVEPHPHDPAVEVAASAALAAPIHELATRVGIHPREPAAPVGDSSMHFG